MEEQRTTPAFPCTAFIALTNDKPSYQDVRLCVTACHRIALAYLITKSPQLNKHNLLGMSLEDLAIDSIADLFERDVNGAFPQFQRYLRTLKNIAQVENEDFFIAIRRLVFSAVNNRLFRIYGLEDPVGAKVLRNLKLELKRSHDVREDEHAGERIVLPSGPVHADNDRPVLPPEFLACELSPCIGPRATMPEVLSAVSKILRAQTLYRKAIPLYQLAHVIKSLMIARGGNQVDESDDFHAISEQDIRQLSEEVVDGLRRERGLNYVENKRLTHENLTAHLRAIQDILIGTFAEQDGNAESFFAILQRHMPELTKESYGTRHRVILEYFARSAKTRMAVILRKEFQVL